jgi:hypothetical protein
MALTKVSRGLLSTGIVDNSNATAITLNADESATFAGSVGIGVSSASKGLHLNFSNDLAAIRFQNAANAKVWDLTPSIPNVANSGFSLHNVTDNTVPLHVDNSGSVGIGVVPETWQSTIDALQVGLGGSFAGNTVNPSRVYLSANYYINSSNQESYIATDEASQYFQNAGTHTFKVAPSGTADSAISWITAATIDNSGNLLVGCTSVPTGGSSTGFSISDNGGKQMVTHGVTGTGNTYVNIYKNANGTVGGIRVNGSQTFFDGSSDQRLKSNIIDAPSASEDIDAIQVRSFNWKVDNEYQKYGMIAQELATVAPIAVYQPEDPEEMQAVDYSKLIPMMLKEIQSLRTRVQELENN